MSKIIKPLAIAATIAIAFIPGAGPWLAMAAQSVGFSAAAAAAIPGFIATMGVASSLSVLGKTLTKVPRTPLGQLDRLNASINPNAGRTMVLGETAMGTDIRYVEPSGDDQEFIDYIIGLACHRVQSIDEIWFEDRFVSTIGLGIDPYWDGYLEIATRVEGRDDNTIAINGGALWGSTRRLTGCAYVWFRIRRSGLTRKAESPFVGGLPSRITIKGKGQPCYDPRQDGSIGGSGYHRADNQDSWPWGDHCKNTAIQILAYLLGWRINGELSVGRGLDPALIDMASFVTAANICDEDVPLKAGGTEKRYRSAAVISEDDDPAQALAGLLAACNGRLRDVGGRLTLAIMHDDLATAAGDPGLFDDDVLSGFTWDPAPNLPDIRNIVRGKYIDPSDEALYQLVDYPEVSSAAVGGVDRILPLNLVAVESPTQAQRIAHQVMMRTQYQRKFSAVFSNRAWKYQVGDIVPLTFGPLGWTEKLFRVDSQTITYDGTCPMDLIEEDAAIYAWDAATQEKDAIEAGAAIAYDPLKLPWILALAETASAETVTTVQDTVAAQEIVIADQATTIGTQSAAIADLISRVEALETP